jgi:putative two-component system response regulator
MKQHPQMGADIIGNHEDELLQTARTIALTHHERWDGSGYPYGLRGEAIPLAGRIVAIADVFDALLSVRPYKPALPLEEALLDYVRPGRLTLRPAADSRLQERPCRKS